MPLYFSTQEESYSYFFVLANFFVLATVAEPTEKITLQFTHFG